MVKSLSSRSPRSSIAAATKRSLRAWARARALRSDRSTLSCCQLGTCTSAGCWPFFGFTSVDRAMVPRFLKVDVSQEAGDDLPYRIGAPVMGGVGRARDLDIPCPLVQFGEPLRLLAARRFVLFACQQQNRALDTGQRLRRQLGTSDAVFVKGRYQLTPVFGVGVPPVLAS